VTAPFETVEFTRLGAERSLDAGEGIVRLARDRAGARSHVARPSPGRTRWRPVGRTDEFRSRGSLGGCCRAVLGSGVNR
jgi:hypothetical protein